MFHTPCRPEMCFSPSAPSSSSVLRFASALLLALGLAACDSGGGSSEEMFRDVEETFSVTVVEAPDDYAYGDQNDVGVVYAIDGMAAMEITLEPGETYAFELEESVGNGPNGLAHPFYLGSTAEGGGGDEYGTGVDNAKATTGTVFFTPPSSAPNSLFYQCESHVYMGGQITIAGGSDSSGGY